MYLGILVTAFLAIGSFVNVLFNALKTVISDHRNIGFQYIKTQMEYQTMKENTEYLELFIIVEDATFQQGQENLIFFFKISIFSIKISSSGNSDKIDFLFNLFTNP